MDPKRKQKKKKMQSPAEKRERLLAVRALDACTVKKCGGPLLGTRKDVARKTAIHKKLYKSCDEKYPTPKDCSGPDFLKGKCKKAIDRRVKCFIRAESATKSDKAFLKKMSKDTEKRWNCRDKVCKPQLDRMMGTFKLFLDKKK